MLIDKFMHQVIVSGVQYVDVHTQTVQLLVSIGACTIRIGHLLVLCLAADGGSALMSCVGHMSVHTQLRVGSAARRVVMYFGANITCSAMKHVCTSPYSCQQQVRYHGLRQQLL